MNRIVSLALILVACASSPHGFPLRAPLAVDPDRDPFAPKPASYTSSLAWDAVDNSIFARISRGLSVDVSAEAANANSLDEVADSSWYENRKNQTSDEIGRGGCAPDDLLPGPSAVADGEWIVDHGKDDGSTLGFRINVAGKKYLLKADAPEQPERSSAASVIGMAVYHALGFNAPCEQIVYVRPEQLTLRPNLTVTDNAGFTHPFDAKALKHVLESSTHRGNLVRMEASKWLSGTPIGPFRYEGTRDDDRNDVVAHENRRELRGSRILSAWINHYDAREQNSLDIWVSSDAKSPKAPGYVRHYILDVSDVVGGDWDPDAMTSRLGQSYYLDFTDIGFDFITLGTVDRPWDSEHKAKGHEKFGYFSADFFDPETWKSGYPNPAFLRMTERDAAWMARKIAQLSPDDVRAIAVAGSLTDASDVEYVTQTLLARQHSILARYLTRLSPLGDVHIDANGQLCATDFARLRSLFAPNRFVYNVSLHVADGRQTPMQATVGDAGSVCVAIPHVAAVGWPNTDPRRKVTIEISNGASSGPITIYAYDLGERGYAVAGIER